MISTLGIYLTLAIVSSVVLGCGALVLTAQEDENKQGELTAIEGDANSEAPRLSCSGMIVDEKSEPVAGAKVSLYYQYSRYGQKNRIVAQVSSGVDGRFEMDEALIFQKNVNHSYARDSYTLLVTHEDYALGWQSVEQGADYNSYKILLTEPTTKLVTVTNHEGDPLAGARVWMSSAGNRKSSKPYFRKHLSIPTDAGITGAITDANGVATISNLPKTDCVFNADLEGYATAFGKTSIRMTKGAEFSGTVLTSGNTPIVDATVQLKTDWMWHFFRTTTDSQGRFSFRDLPAKGWDRSMWGRSEGANGVYNLTIEHDLYASPEQQITLIPGKSEKGYRINGIECTRVTCSVIYADTGLPIAGARIGGHSESGRIDGYTDSNGIFIAKVLPGPVRVFFDSPPDGVYVERNGNSLVDFTARGREMDITIKGPEIGGQLISVRGIVLDEDNQPLQNVSVYADAGHFEAATALSYIRPTGTNGDGQFELNEVPAGRTLYLYAEKEDYSQAGVSMLEIPANPDEPLRATIKLTPTQGGAAVIKLDGKPLTQMPLTVCPIVDGHRFWPSDRNIRTDDQGKLEINGILPGVEYFIRDSRVNNIPNKLPEGFEQTLILNPVQLVE